MTRSQLRQTTIAAMTSGAARYTASPGRTRATNATLAPSPPSHAGDPSPARRKQPTAASPPSADHMSGMACAP